MAGLAPGASEHRAPISGAFLSLLAVSFSELRRDLALLLESDWAEPVRRRADELAATLVEACDREGLGEVAAQARSLAHLARMSRAQALPLQSAVREKVDELLREVQRQLSRQSRRHSG